jgi:hypothetical protein
MRLILTNEDARRLERLIEENPDAELRVRSRGGKRTAATMIEGIAVTVSVGDSEAVRCTAQPTPTTPGTFVIQDADGRRTPVAGVWVEGQPG